MRTVGSRELKTHLSEVLRHVRERHETYAITHRGRVVARLVPAAEQTMDEEFEAVWAEMDQLAAEIGQEWPEGVTAADAVRGERREL
jgi:prevent-host-death family protein